MPPLEVPGGHYYTGPYRLDAGYGEEDDDDVLKVMMSQFDTPIPSTGIGAMMPS